MTPEEVEAICEGFGCNQRKLAGHLRVRPATVNRWERGKMPVGPQSELLLEILRCFLESETEEANECTSVPISASP